MRTNVGHIISDNSRNVNNRTAVGKNVGEEQMLYLICQSDRTSDI